MVDAFVVYALRLLFRVRGVDEVYRRAAVAVVGCYYDDSVTGERAADM